MSNISQTCLSKNLQAYLLQAAVFLLIVWCNPKRWQGWQICPLPTCHFFSGFHIRYTSTRSWSDNTCEKSLVIVVTCNQTDVLKSLIRTKAVRYKLVIFKILHERDAFEWSIVNIKNGFDDEGSHKTEWVEIWQVSNHSSLWSEHGV